MTIDKLRIIFTYIQNAVKVERETVEIPKTRTTQIITNIFLQNDIIIETQKTYRNKVKKYSLFINFKYFGIY